MNLIWIFITLDQKQKLYIILNKDSILQMSHVVKKLFCIIQFDNVKKQKLYEELIILTENQILIRQDENFSKFLNSIIDLFSNTKVYKLGCLSR